MSSAGTKAKRVGLTTLKALGVLVAVVAALVGVTIVVLKTDWGGERVRRQVVKRVNQEIRGTLDIQRLSLGGNKLAVWGVVLKDPEGQTVAQVARFEVAFSLVRLLRKEIRVTAVAIETPVLGIVSDDDGSNLARATAPRKKSRPEPKEPKKKTTEEGWVFQLDRLDITRGDLSTAVATPDGRDKQLHVAALTVFANLRYATGNGSLDLVVRLSGKSERVPVGPLRLSADVHSRGAVHRFAADGDLLGGTLKAHGSVDGKHLQNADGSVVLAIPAQALAGHTWGPVRVDARATPGTAPRLDASVAVPGLQLTAKDRGPDVLGVSARLKVTDLGLTGRAVQALTGGELPPLGGRGELEVALEKPTSHAPDFGGRTKGAFETLRFGDTVITRLALAGQARRLSSRPGDAAFELTIASVNSGKTKLRGLALATKVREQDVSVTFGVAAPARVDLALAGRLDDDQRGFSLATLSLTFPEGRWISQGTARLRSEEQGPSLSNLRLVSEGQSLAVDASRRGEALAAHLALVGLRLEKLPTSLMDPALRLGGTLDVDVKAEGKADAPQVAARAELREGRYQGFSKLGVKLAATLRDEQLTATLEAEAPFMKASAALEAPSEPLEPGAPIDLKLDVKHLDVGQVLRAAEMAPLGDGRLNLKVHVNGSADAPKLDLAIEAFDLEVNRPAQPERGEAKGKGKTSVDVGRARLHVTYAERAARAELDFKSGHGGSLVVDASTRVDLSYPRVTRKPIVAAKLPVNGKVVAKDLDVAWLAQMNPRVESMGGQVTADAKLGGTVGDPHFVGDVRWKNGQVIATAPPPATTKPITKPSTSPSAAPARP